MANDKSINMPNLDQEDKLTARSPGSTSGNKSIREVDDYLEECFRSVEEKVMKWECSRTKIWDSGVVAVSEYLQAINESQRLGEILRNLHVTNEGGVEKDEELLHRVQIVTRITMVKLEEEFSHILVRRNRPFEPECMSFHSSDVGSMDEISISSFDFNHNLVDELSSRYSSSTYSGKHIIDLVHQCAIPDMNQIVNAMFTNHSDLECCDAYINARKNALVECLFMLEVDSLSIAVGEAGLNTEISKIKEGKRSTSFIIKIKKWNRAMKIISDYLAREKLLCDRVFGVFNSVSSTCLAKIFEVSMLQLLKYGEAIIDKGRGLGKLLLLRLDMYEVLRDLLSDIDNTFLEEAGSSVRFAFHEVLKRSGDSVRETVLEFEKANGSSILTKPLTGGGVCLQSKHVMAYMASLAPYRDTLNMVLEVSHGGDLLEDGSSSTVHPLVCHLKLVASNLKSNLDVKSLLYTDDALRYIFLMNNIYYMVSKVKKNSNLRKYFGDCWIRQHVAEYQGYAMNYERATWRPILSLLRYEGMFIPGTRSISKRVLKERLKDFNLSFEKVYKSQTAWLIPDPQLREERRISVSINVFQAYRTVIWMHEGKFIKYSSDELQTYISDLFGGSPKLLPNSART